jgi:hypothetical protein
VPVDVSVYDIPKRLKDSGSVPPATFKAVFGETEDLHRKLSPVTHVAKGKNIPPFLILHVADRLETKAQSHWLADKLKEAGVPAQVVAAAGTTHGTINANLGKSGDRPSELMWTFLDSHLSRADPSATEPIDHLRKLGARITFDDHKRVIGVNLSERRVTDADLVYLKGLAHLLELDLTRTRITGPGLVNVKDSTSLRRLFVTDTKVDDAGLAHLKGLKSLELIGLSGTRITDGALAHLRELTGLKQVLCLGTAVTDAGVEMLQRARPQCRITP